MQHASADAPPSLTLAQERAARMGAKAMMPVDDSGSRPFLDYVLSGLADAGLDDVCLVVARGESAIRDRYTGAGPVSRVTLTFAEQQEPRGTADAVCAARRFAADQQFVVLNADNYYPESALRAVAAIDGAGLAAFEAGALIAEGNFPADRIRSFALLRASAHGELRDIVEKPAVASVADIAASALISMNLWSLTSPIFEACEHIVPSPRGELELVDAVRYAMRVMGVRFSVVRCGGGVLDLSNRGDIAAVSDRLRTADVRL
jgi:glucose-1-phosphate thymidylyltransferase